MTGNTEKVAMRFKQVFEKMGWECDLLKIKQDTDLRNPLFDCNDYDFICVGSWVQNSLPSEKIIDAMHHNPGSAHYSADADPNKKPGVEEVMRRQRTHKVQPRKITFDHGDKKGIVFVTFGGVHMGWKEALPALVLLEHEMEHLHFQSAGRFSCPGFFGPPEGWFKDWTQRPHERDLLKAQIFLEEILEDIE